MPATPIPIDPFLPDGATYTIVINERMRRLLHASVKALIIAQLDDEDAATPEARLEQQTDDEVLESMLDMLDPNGSVGPLHPHPAINSFVM